MEETARPEKTKSTKIVETILVLLGIGGVLLFLSGAWDMARFYVSRM